MKLIKVPFFGFYETLHSDVLNEAKEQEDSSENLNFRYTKELLESYCTIYLEKLSEKLGITLNFESLVSPHEYNLTTDVIYAQISEKDIYKLQSLVSKDELNSKIKERFTSREGFISFYPNNIKSWDQDILNWDEIQLSILLECILDEDKDFQYHSMCEAYSNGEIKNIIYKGYIE